MEYLTTLFKISLIQNMVLAQFLGLCPFVGVSKRREDAFGMGLAVIFVMTLASLVAWTVERLILTPYGIGYLRTIVYILVIATLVQLVEMIIRKVSPALYDALGIYLPLITTNCAVLGVTLLNQRAFADRTAFASLTLGLVQGAGGGLGFMLAMLLMAGIRERLELAAVPRAMRGLPIAFICAGLMAFAFLGFVGIVR
ncbi:MAG: RnfABCDGE type electron transport complex subunit A [Planctomycetes bacterium]|nr:RnfABCDGE type electron transport complex subunit A [Planctomycetota bacterium]